MKNKTTIELEHNELVESPVGKLLQLKGATHAQGGIDMEIVEPDGELKSNKLPYGSKIYSPKTKVYNPEIDKVEDMKARKLRRVDEQNIIEKNLNKLEKKAKEGDKVSMDTYNRAKDNAKTSFARIQKEDSDDVLYMDMVNDIMGTNGERKYGGTYKLKYPYGGFPEGAYKDSERAIDYYSDGRQLFLVNEDGSHSLLNPRSSSAIKDYSGLTHTASGMTAGELRSKPTAIENNLEKRLEEFMEEPITPELDLSDKLVDPKTGEFVNTSDIKEANSTEGILSDDNTGNRIGQLGAVAKTLPTLVTLFNRLTDTSNPNLYSDAGVQGQEIIQDAIDSQEGALSNILKQNTLKTNAQINRNRTSSRGVNTNRSLDIATLNAQFAAEGKELGQHQTQIARLLQTKAYMADKADELQKRGATEADENNRKDKDAFATNLSKNLVDSGLALQEYGKSYNSQIYNQDFLNLLPLLNEEAIGEKELAIIKNNLT